MLIADYDYEEDIAVQREEAARLALAQGLSRGLEEGIAQGANSAKLETAKAMISENLSLQMIARCTGLTLETLENLEKN